VKTCLIKRGVAFTGSLVQVVGGSLASRVLHVKGVVSGIKKDIVAEELGLEDNSQPSIPLEKSNSELAEETEAAAEGKDRRAVTSTVRDRPFVLCHLACGHLFTLHSGEVAAPFSRGCWACEAEGREL
jgi:hypothetical protein